MVQLRAVLFDAAGTLIETARPVGETYAERAREHGVRLSAGRLGDAFRRILAGAAPLVFPEAPGDRLPELERDWWRTVVRSTFLAADGTARFRDFDAFFAGLYAHYAGAAAWAVRPEHAMRCCGCAPAASPPASSRTSMGGCRGSSPGSGSRSCSMW